MSRLKRPHVAKFITVRKHLRICRVLRKKISKHDITGPPWCLRARPECQLLFPSLSMLPGWSPKIPPAAQINHFSLSPGYPRSAKRRIATASCLAVRLSVCLYRHVRSHTGWVTWKALGFRSSEVQNPNIGHLVLQENPLKFRPISYRCAVGVINRKLAIPIPMKWCNLGLTLLLLTNWIKLHMHCGLIRKSTTLDEL